MVCLMKYNLNSFSIALIRPYSSPLYNPPLRSLVSSSYGGLGLNLAGLKRLRASGALGQELES